MRSWRLGCCCPCTPSFKLNVCRYIDLLCDVMLVRRLPAWHDPVGNLVLTFPDQTIWAIEIKRSSAPTL